MVAAIGRTKTITKKGEFELAAADKSLPGASDRGAGGEDTLGIARPLN